MNDVSGILSTLASKWDKLNDTERNALATSIAGVRQRENFIVLMQNYGKAVEYTEDALDSAGTAEQKFGAYTEGIEAKINSMKASLEGWATNLIDSDLIKGIIDATTGLIKFADTFKIVQILFIGLMAIGIPKLFVLISKSVASGINSFKTYSLALKASASGHKVYSDSVLLAKTKIDVFIGSLTRAGIPLTSLSQKQLVALMSTIGLEESTESLNKDLIIEKLTLQGVDQATAEAVATKVMDTVTTETQKNAEIGLIEALKIRFAQTMKNIGAFISQNVALSVTIGLLAAVAIGFAIYTAAAKKNAEQLEENVNKAKEAREETENQIESIKDLEEEYEKLQSKTVLDETDQERIVEIEKELNKQIELINKKIEEGNDRELEKLETLNLQNGEYTKQKNILSQLDETTSKILANETKSEKIAQQKKVQEEVGDKAVLSYSLGSTPDDKVGKILEEAFGVPVQRGSSGFSTTYGFNFSSNADEMITQLKALQEARDYYLETYTDEELMNNEVYNSIVSTINKYGELIDTYETATLKYWQTDINKDIIEDQKSTDYIEDEKYKIVDSTEAMEAYIAQLQKEAKVKNGGVEISEEYAQAIRDAVEKAFPQFVKGSIESKNATLKLQHTLEGLKNTYEVLESAIEEYNSAGSISYDTWEDLIALEDQYLSLLIDENGQIKSNTKAIQDLMRVKIEEATLDRMETYVKNLLTAAQQGNLDQILLSTEGLDANTNARLQNIMAIIASNPELMKNSKAILQNLSAMAQLTSSISLGSDSTKDAKDATEEWEKVLEYTNTILDEQIEKLEKEQEALEKLTEEKIKAHEAEIKRLEEEKELLEEKNDEKNKEIELEKLKANLQKAKQRTMRVYYADKGWVWEQDPEAIQEAQQELDDFYTEQKIDNIDKQIEAEEKKIEELEDGLDKEIKSYEERIRKIEEYKKKWEQVPKDYEKTQNEIAAKARLGANAEKEILIGIDNKGGRLKVLEDFKAGYTKALGEVATETEKSANRVNTALGSFNFEKMIKMLEIAKPQGQVKFGGKLYDFLSETITGVVSGEKFIRIKNSSTYFKESDLTKVDGGWIYKANTNYYAQPYASGTLSAKAGLANVDEKGSELIVPKQGRYRMMEYGDTVVPHNLSQRLFDVASNPLRFIANALNSVKTPNLMSNSSRISNASTINIGTIELPSVTNGESFIKQLQLIAANR